MSGTFSTPRNTVQPMVAPSHADNLRDFIGEQLIDLQKYNTALAGITAQLDADAGVTDTDYAATWDVTLTLDEADQVEARNPVAPLLIAGVSVLQADTILTDLTAVKAAIAGINAKLDADAGVTDTDYASTWDMSALTVTALDESDVEARNSVAPMLTVASFAAIRAHSALVVADLAAVRAAIVGITAKLDADGGVTDTDYAANNDPAAALVAALTA